MSFFAEIDLCQVIDISPYYIWSRIFFDLHNIFVGMQDTEGNIQIGISMPEYDKYHVKLGNKLRLHSKLSSKLEIIDLPTVLKKYMEYISLSPIRQVPKNIKGYAIYKRIQKKGNYLKLARRKAKRTSMSVEEAISCYDKYRETQLKMPYIKIKSSSTGQDFSLFINKILIDQANSLWTFNTYGLSDGSTVPEF